MADDGDDDDNMNQTQRPGSDSAAEEEEEEEEANDTMDLDQRPGVSFEDQLAKKLVRYALSCEFSRTPIRRQGIREKGEVPFVGRRNFEDEGR